MPAVREIEVEASPEEVWEALSTEEGRERWLEEPDRERFHDLMTGLVATGRCRWISNEGRRVLPRVTGALEVPSGRFVTALDGVPVAWSHGHGHAIDWLP